MDRIRGLEILGIDIDNLVGNSTTCPKCSHNRIKSSQRCLSVDIVTGHFFCNHCGWKGRADSDEWLDQGLRSKRGSLRTTGSIPMSATKPITILPEIILNRFVREPSNLTLFLQSKFNKGHVDSVLNLFEVYTTQEYWSRSTVFIQRDISSQIRQIKIMDYDPHTGKRVIAAGNGHIVIAGRIFAEELGLKDIHMSQCFFGEHLLNKFPEKVVGIVESEKTAIIASICIPEMVWLATGGKNGCRWYDPKVFKVLDGRVIELYPDNDQIQEWRDLVYDHRLGRKTVINVRDDFRRMMRVGEEKHDIADYILQYNRTNFI
jgi:predicted RNA-binding Zn-ribbon protein involved in translation (DUF1610 family)